MNTFCKNKSVGLKFLIGVFIIIWSGACFGQSTVTVIDGSNESDYMIDFNYYYGLTQSIYHADEIGSGGTISKIWLKYDGDATMTTTSFKIYLGHTSKNQFNNNTDWVSNSDLTLVYSAATTFSSDGWKEIVLDTPFSYDGIDNLVLGIDKEDNSYSSSPEFYHAWMYYDAHKYRTIYQYSDYSNKDFSSPGTANGHNYYLGNLKLEISSVPTISYVSATYCSSDSDPSPTLTNNAGAGTYSSTSGLVFADVSSNSGSSTGVIDISASTAGSYTITYTDTDSPPSTATFDVTISSTCQLLITDADFTGCDAVIKDDGGSSNYSNDIDEEIVLTPTSGNAKLVFSSFSTESSYDYLYIYEDDGASWSLIGTYDGTTSPGTIVSNGTTGKLKLKFTSDGSTVSSGFEATMSCYIPPPSLSASWTVGDGAFAACESTASSVEQYTVNASNLIGDLTATPPAGFEISLSSGSGYISNPSTLTIPQANAEAGDIIYVRMASGSSSPTTANLSISGGGLASATTTSLSGTITATPDAGTLSGTSAVCSDGSTTFSSNGDAGGTWTSGSTGVATINSSTGAISPVAGGTSTITYTVTGTGGCSDATSTRDVVVTAAPNAGTLSGTNAICSDGSTTFSSNGDSGGVWSSGDTGVATVNSSTGAITPVAGGTSTITYTVTGTGGCSDAASTRDVTISSDTYYVKPAASGGSDSNNGLTLGTAFATLQKAIDMVGCSSTTINIAAGTYTEDDIRIPEGTSNLSIIGAGIDLTVLDGDRTNSGFIIDYTSTGSSNITISGMTIKEMTANSSEKGGGGIRVEQASNVTIENIKFEDNKSYTGSTTSGETANWGGGVFVTSSSSSVSIKSCIFKNNWADDNGGAIATYGTLTIENSLFYDNSCDDDGSAVNDWGTTTANNCTFTENTAGSNGVVYNASSSTSSYNNCIFHNNSGSSSYVEGYESSGTLSYNNCLISGNIHSGITKNSTVSTSDPQFTDASSDDYTLQSSSPAVDAGSSSYAPATDILGVSRPKGSADDLGCYEFSPNTWVGGTSLNETTWTTASNWSNGTVPTSSESPIIPNVTNQPVISSSVTLAGLTIDSGADISISSNSLTVTGTFDLNGKMYVENATVNADGTFDATGGEIDFQNTNGKLILSSDVTSLGTLDAAMGTVEYDNSSACDILSDTYYNLELDGSSAKTAVGDVTVNGDFTIQSACTRYRTGSYTTTVEGNSDINSELRINGASAIFDANGIFDATGGTVDMNNSAARLKLSSSVTSLGTLDELVGTVEYDGSTQNVLADAYYNLELDQSGTKTSQGTITVANDLTVQSAATFAIDATTITVTGTSDVNGTTTLSTGTFNSDGASDIDGTLSITSTGVYDADGAFDATNGNVTFTGNGRLQCSSTVTSLGSLSSDNGTVEYDGSTQNVLADAYNNLEIDQSGTKTSQGTITVANDLTVQSGATFAIDATTITVTGTSDVNGTTTLSTGTYNADGASDIDGTLSITSSGVYDADGSFDATNGTISFSASSSNLVTNGDNGSTTGWSVTANGGNGWGSGENRGGTVGSFVGSYSWCKKTQTIDLVSAGFTTGELDAEPSIEFSEWFKGQQDWNAGWAWLGGYYCKVSLLNSSSSEVTSQTAGSTSSTSTANSSSWAETAFTFNSYGTGVRYVKIEHWSRDNGGYGGHYGTRIDDVSLTVSQTNENGTLRLSGTVTSLGTLSNSGGIVEYDGSTQNVLADAYYNLEIDQSGTKTSQGTITVASDLTVQSGSTFAIDATTITVTGTSDINGTTTLSTGTFNADGLSDIVGTLSITSTGVYDADGSFDATNGNVTFTGNGRLQCSSIVTSLGTLSSDNGTVEYDGATQTVFGDNYYNLEIDVSGTKSAGGAINVDGNLSTSATAGCKLDMGAYALNIAGDLTVGATDGLDLTDGSSLVAFDGSGDQNINHVGQSSTPTLLNESFATTSLPTDWTRSSASYVEFVTGCTVGASSDNYARLEGVGDSWLATKSVDASLGLDLDISFYYRSGCLNSAESGDCATVQYWNGSSWNDLTGWPKCGAESNTLFTQTLSGLSNSDFKLRFYINSGSGSDYDDWDFDEISIVQSGPNPILNDLTINNSGGNIILNDEISVNGTITFTSGDIDASSNNLVLKSNASVSGADDDSHVVGTIVKTIASDASHEFPLGNGSVLRKVDIDPNDATSRDWTVTYTDNVYSDVTTTGLLTYVSDTCYWDITPTSTPASTTVKLNWTSAIGINDADLSNIKLAHFNGTDWELISTTTSGVPLAGSVSGNVTSFSPFTIGTTGANPLPVTLTQFEGYAYSDLDNKLEWTTKTEKNADYMEIQHSDDGKYFNSIGISKLAGNSQTDLFYEFIDRSVAKQINYYRLKQFDYDGKFNYSKIISIDNRHTEARVVKYMTNLIGQKVDKNYKGVVIIYYTDGSSIKTIQ